MISKPGRSKIFMPMHLHGPSRASSLCAMSAFGSLASLFTVSLVLSGCTPFSSIDDISSRGRFIHAPCGKTSAIVDRFDAADRKNTWNLAWWSHAALNQGDGFLSVTPESGRDEKSDFELETSMHLDLTDSSVSVEVPTMFDTATDAYALLGVRSEKVSVKIVQQKGTLRVDRQSEGGETLARGPYDPVMHRWWRIKDTNGSVVAETSPDGVQWAPLGSTPRFEQAHRVKFFLGGGDESDDNAGTLRFANLNAGSETTPLCPTARVRSDLVPDPENTAVWASDAHECQLDQKGGQLVIVGNADRDSWCWYGTERAYAFTNTSVFVRVAQTMNTAQKGTWTALVLKDEEEHEVNLHQSGADLCCTVRTGDSKNDFCSAAYNATAHLWWRLRDDNGTLFCEASPDGRTWTNIATSPHPMTTPVSVELSAGASKGSDPGSALFDLLNGGP